MLTVIQGDCRDKLRELADESVHCVISSPPYWGLRDYGTARWEGGDEDCPHEPPQDWIDHNFNANSAFGSGAKTQSAAAKGRWYNADGSCRCGARRIDSQLGLESTPEQYVAEMVAIFREVRRVLRSDGTCWVNLGDSYAGGGFCGSEKALAGKQGTNGGSRNMIGRPLDHGLKPKDLCGIPWMVAFALRADGWYLRSEIIWHKPNPMPESVTDRPTKAHEQVFLLAKSSRYFYDAEAIRERAQYGEQHANKATSWGTNRKHPNKANVADYAFKGDNHTCHKDADGYARNRRSVWTIATAPYSDAHFATFPPKLVEPCVLAGTSARGCCAACGAPWERVVAPSAEYAALLDANKGNNHVASRDEEMEISHRGQIRTKHGGISAQYVTTGWQPTCEHDSEPVPCTVLDPFAGSGTVGKVALELGRRAVLIELNPKYCEMIQKRSEVTLGLPGLA